MTSDCEEDAAEPFRHGGEGEEDEEDEGIEEELAFLPRSPHAVRGGGRALNEGSLGLVRLEGGGGGGVGALESIGGGGGDSQQAGCSSSTSSGADNGLSALIKTMESRVIAHVDMASTPSPLGALH